jgi:hypothetical protein
VTADEVARRAVPQVGVDSEVPAAGSERRLGDQVEHAADGVAAVEHRHRPAYDLDRRNVVDVDQRRELAEVGLTPRVVHAQPVFHEQDAQAALAADHRPGLIDADAVDVDAGLLAQQVGGVVGQTAGDLDLLDDGDRRRHLEDVGLAPERGDGRRVVERALRLFGGSRARIRRGGVGRGGRRCRLLRKDRQRKGEDR